MTKRLCGLVALATVVWSAPGRAQEPRAEISVIVGWVFSDGVHGDPVATGDGAIYDRVDPKNSFTWGLGGGALLNDNAEVGFLFGQQLSTLQASGTNSVDVGDMTINRYHGYFAYNFLDPRSPARPYVFGGLGATNFSAVEYTRLSGQPGTIGGLTRFSSTWGAGVKVYANPRVGARFGVQWTPTYIKSDAVGWWCD